MTLLLLALLACSGDAPPAPAPTAETTTAPAAPALPATSTAVGLPAAPLYDVPIQLEDQDGQKLGFDAFRGHPTVFTMFYTSCSASSSTG
jgi:cytochrome oxidase Cu insertion factor (SCO1/SenC/PrrC family)